MIKFTSIATKIKLFCTIFGFLLLAQFSLIINNARTLEQHLSSLQDRDLAMVNIAYDLRNSTIQVQQWLTDISATRGQDGLDDGFSVARKYHDKFVRSLAQLEKLDPGNAANYQSWLSAFKAYYHSGQQMARAYVAEGPAAGNAMMSGFDTQAERINTLVETNLSTVTTAMAKALQDNRTVVHTELRYLYVFGALYTVLFVLLIIGAQRWIKTPLHILSDRINSMAKQQSTAHPENASVDISTLDQSEHTELGRIGGALASLLLILEEQHRIMLQKNDENMRIREALDNASSSVMLANTDLDIVYVNKSSQALFDNASADIRTELPHFDPQQLLGTNIDHFHKNPTHQRKLLAQLSGTYSGEFVVGGRTLGVQVNPVISSEGERLGMVAEWIDRTQEVALEHEIEEVILAAKAGELDRRIDLDNKHGFIRNLSQCINELLEKSSLGINDTIEVMSAMATGNLTRRIDSDYQGAFGQLKIDTNSTTQKFTQVVSDIKSAASLVRQGALEISQGNLNLSARTEQQAASLEETAASMEELTSTVKSNADNASQASQLATGARDKAVSGGDVVSQTITSMEAISTSSNQIADIIGVIDEIAFQTNLLALNAAVEAARAGEQGRGFAVVATEVRNLAQRSAKAAKEIKDLIQDSVRKVNDGKRLVDASGAVLEEIVQAIKKVSDIAAEIASASAEQSAGIEDTNKAIMEMDAVTQKNAALVEEASVASQTLDEQAAKMEELVGFFTITPTTDRSESPAASPDPSSVIENRRALSQRPWSQPPENNKVAIPRTQRPSARTAAGIEGAEWEEF